jgi:hypothetical protein
VKGILPESITIKKEMPLAQAAFLFYRISSPISYLLIFLPGIPYFIHAFFLFIKHGIIIG